MSRLTRRVALVIPTIIAARPVTAREVRSYQALRYSGIARQGAEPSCAVASVVTILNRDFGQSLAVDEAWLGYLAQLDIRQRDMAMQNGLSIADILRLTAWLGYRAHAVQLTLPALARIRRPAIVHLERGAPREYRHFAVFDGVENSRVLLADPATGNRRMHAEHFLREWRGHAIFVTLR